MICKRDIKIELFDHTISKGGLHRGTYRRNDFLVPFPSEAPLKRKMIKEGNLTEGKSFARIASSLLGPFSLSSREYDLTYRLIRY